MDTKTFPPPVRYPGTPVDIDGMTFILPPLSLGAIERAGNDFADMIDGKLTLQRIGFLVDIITDSLARNYPGIDRKRIAAGIDLSSLATIAAALVATANLTCFADEPPVKH